MDYKKRYEEILEEIGSLERLMVDEALEAVFEGELIKMCNGGLDLNTGLGVDH